MKHLNIILANAPINSGNRGCVALTVSIMSLLAEIFEKKNVGYTLYLPDAGYTEESEMQYKTHVGTLSYNTCNYDRSINVLGTAKIKLENFLYKRNTNTIFNSADYIIDIGQGDSFADIYGDYRFKVIDRIHRIAIEKKIPYCILPQTIGPFSNPAIKAIANDSISKASLCMVRDRQSYNYVKENVPSQINVREYIDVAFFLPYQTISHSADKIHVGLNISSLLWHGGYTQDNQFGLVVDYPKLVHKIIQYFLGLEEVVLHLIPHVVERERCIENDYEVAYDLWKEYNNERIVLAPFALGPIEIKSYISGLDFFLGARMHSTIGAFSAGVPVVPMAYSRKFNGLFKDTLDYEFMVDLKSQNIDEILEKISESYVQRDFIKHIIDARMEGIVREKKEIFLNELSHFFGLDC